MHDSTLVRVERTQLLIEACLFHLLREQLRHLPQLDVLALPVLERIDEHPSLVGQSAAVRHVDDVLQRLERLAAMTDEQLRVGAADVEARTVRRLLEIDRGADAQGRRDASEKLDDWLR